MIELVLRVVTALLFVVAFFGVARDWDRRQTGLTMVGRRQYWSYALMMVTATSVALYKLALQAPFVWLDVAWIVVAVVAAFTSNWRLHEEVKP